jgi:hypothetical protein
MVGCGWLINLKPSFYHNCIFRLLPTRDKCVTWLRGLCCDISMKKHTVFNIVMIFHVILTRKGTLLIEHVSYVITVCIFVVVCDSC